MKKKITLILCIALISAFSFAQEIKVISNSGEIEYFDLSDIDNITFTPQNQDRDLDNLLIHTSNGINRLSVDEIDSLYFNSIGTIGFFQTANTLHQVSLNEIDSLTFADQSDSTIYINFSSTAASVTNPLENYGVTISVSGNDVIVNSTTDMNNLNYILSGTTGDGMLKIYSESDFTLTLNDVAITNLDGPAINIQADVEINVRIPSGTTSTLTDGVTYTDPVDDEDQKAAFFSEGQLIFNGSGSLTVVGQGDDQHGLVSDDYITINDGDITVQSATKDGIHTNEGYYQNGGTIDVTSDGDGIDAGDGPCEITSGALTVLSTADDVKGMKCDSEIRISGGQVDLTVEGDQSKAIKSAEVFLTGGVLDIDVSGGVVLEASDSGYDPSYCTAIKGEELVEIDGCQIDITATGEAARGISSDGDVNLLSGSLTINSSGDGDSYINESGENDAYHGPCIKADGDISIISGNCTLTNTGDGGKAIKSDGHMIFGDGTSIPVINITTSGQSITVVPGTGGPHGTTGEYAEAKAISADSSIVIHSGDFTISSVDDAVKSKESITINNCTLQITNSVEGLEAPFITVNDGTITVAATDDGFNSTMGTGEGQQDDGSEMNINGGTITINMSGNDVDAMDSNGTITILGGTVYLNFPTQGPSEGLDANGAITIGPNASVYMNGVPYN